MELPKDLRFISLKYAGLCRACATSLKVGERAHWSPSSKEVWCIDCASEESSAQVASDSVVGSSRNAIKNASSNSALNLAANRLHTPWQKLCAYMRNGVSKQKQRNHWSRTSKRTLCGSYIQGKRNWWLDRTTRHRRLENSPIVCLVHAIARRAVNHIWLANGSGD